MADHKDIENARNNGQEEDFKARRRLLKASAAIPLIGTLSPGAALAAASSQCDLDGTTSPEVVMADDKALRMHAVYFEAKHDNLANDIYQVGDRYYDAENGLEVAPDFTGKSGVIRGYRKGVPRYVLCYVDVARDPYTGDVISQRVEITGFFPQQNTGGTEISDSCMASMGGLQSLMYDQANG